MTTIITIKLTQKPENIGKYIVLLKIKQISKEEKQLIVILIVSFYFLYYYHITGCNSWLEIFHSNSLCLESLVLIFLNSISHFPTCTLILVGLPLLFSSFQSSYLYLVIILSSVSQLRRTNQFSWSSATLPISSDITRAITA